jgi:sugar phosphate isomerase/epimerase
MHTSMDRRLFLKTSSTMAVVAGLKPAGRFVSSSSESTNTNAARLFPGCCAYSYARHLDKGAMTMEDLILKGVELGVHAVDLTAYWLKSTEPPYLLRIRQLAFRSCMMFSGVAIKTEMCQSSKTARAEQVKNIKKWIDTTARLGAPHLRVFAGTLPDGASAQQGIEWTAETMKAACEYSAKSGVVLGLEDHHGITARADAVLDIIRRVDSPFAGINLDIDNFDVDSEEERYSDIEACIPSTTHLHIRDVATKTHRPLDLERVWHLLAKLGYKGYVSAEYEGEEDPLTAVPKLVSKIKTLCRTYSSA